ncbi:MAG: hypothetical protein ACPL3C_13215, partial [Pyrobaculum sp.]
YVARATGLGFTNVTVFTAKGPQVVVRVKIPTGKLSVAAVDGFGKVRDWPVEITGVASGNGRVGPVDVLTGRYVARVRAFGLEFTQEVEVGVGEVLEISIQVPTAVIDIVVVDSQGRSLEPDSVRLEGPMKMHLDRLSGVEVLAGTYTVEVTASGKTVRRQVRLDPGQRINIKIEVPQGVTRQATPSTSIPTSTTVTQTKYPPGALVGIVIIAIIIAVALIISAIREEKPPRPGRGPQPLAPPPLPGAAQKPPGSGRGREETEVEPTPYVPEICRKIEKAIETLGQFIEHVKIVAKRMVDIKEFSYELYLDVSELEGSFRALKEYAKGRYQEVVEIVDEILVK